MHASPLLHNYRHALTMRILRALLKWYSTLLLWYLRKKTSNYDRNEYEGRAVRGARGGTDVPASLIVSLASEANEQTMKTQAPLWRLEEAMQLPRFLFIPPPPPRPKWPDPPLYPVFALVRGCGGQRNSCTIYASPRPEIRDFPVRPG